MKKTVGSVSLSVFRGMQAVARKRDLDEGGLFDAREEGAINIWCSPGDKPPGYDTEIACGALAYPRNYVATIVPEPKGSESHKVSLALQVEPESKGEPPTPGCEPTREEVKWAERKLRELVRRGKDILREICLLLSPAQAERR